MRNVMVIIIYRLLNINLTLQKLMCAILISELIINIIISFININFHQSQYHYYYRCLCHQGQQSCSYQVQILISGVSRVPGASLRSR